MHNRINDLFKRKQKNILSIFITAGFPQKDSLVDVIIELEKNGVDLIEIGIPFSDPLADGPIIQQSNEQAIANGMNINVMFKQLKDIRKKVSVPLLFMGYLNPIMRCGIEKFLSQSETIGIDGLIIPDLPLNEYQKLYQKSFKKKNIKNIFLITPQTSTDRIKNIDNSSDGFIYCVSSSTTTGTKDNFNQDQNLYFEKIKKMKLKNPCLIGFGISNHSTFKNVCLYANGAIIGSAFIKALQDSNNIKKSVNAFVESIIK